MVVQAAQELVALAGLVALVVQAARQPCSQEMVRQAQRVQQAQRPRHGPTIGERS